MKFIVLVILTMMIFSSQIFPSQTNNWEGVYTFDEESWDENGIRSYRWFRLVVSKKEEKILATYSDGENGKTWREFSLNVVQTEDKASFYFERNVLSGDISCSESKFVKGDFMFELKELREKGKPILQTIWGKENFATQSEIGGHREGNIFFKKR